MNEKPNETTVAAWVELNRAQRRTTSLVEARLKEAGLPPLAWYDVLWELERASDCAMRPFELERALLFEQYNLSRLADRMVQAGLIRRMECPGDRRGQMLAITPEGRELRKRIWEVYGPAIEEAVGAKLNSGEAVALAGLLRKLPEAGRKKGGE